MIILWLQHFVDNAGEHINDRFTLSTLNIYQKRKMMVGKGMFQFSFLIIKPTVIQIYSLIDLENRDSIIL